MGACELACDRQTQPAAAGASRAEKRPEQIFPRLGRQTVAIVGNLDRNRPALARGGKAQTVGARLDGIPGQVEENPVELIAVGADGKVYVADSGNAVFRGFCGECGSSILYGSAAFPSAVFVTAGSLDDPSWFKPTMVVYASSAQPWDHIEASLRRFDEMPPLPG